MARILRLKKVRIDTGSGLAIVTGFVKAVVNIKRFKKSGQSDGEVASTSKDLTGYDVRVQFMIDDDALIDVLMAYNGAAKPVELSYQVPGTATPKTMTIGTYADGSGLSFIKAGMSFDAGDSDGPTFRPDVEARAVFKSSYTALSELIAIA